MAPLLGDIEGFEWLDWVVEKIWVKHGVDPVEVEECFSNYPQRVRYLEEGKYALLGQANSGRYIMVVYAWNGRWIRVISARDMTLKERSRFRRK